MSALGEALEVQEALAAMLPSFPPREAAEVSLADALGRTLAAPLVALLDQPRFDHSAMDGYAVRAEDIEGAREGSPIPLPLKGESRAGGAAPPPLAAGTAMRIFTGAPLPPGADAVVAQEDTRTDGEQVLIHFASEAGRHVRARASDFSAGDPLMDAGARVSPGLIALAASQGQSTLPVRRRPRVAILATGDELVPIGEALPVGRIHDSNSHLVAALVAAAGAEPWVLERSGDSLEALTEAVRRGLEADVLITTGGVSVGDYDLVREAFEAAGVALDFWKVRIKPGKPLVFGRGPRGPVVGLPGNPVSAFVTFHVFVAPGLLRMQGRPAPAPIEVRLHADHRHSLGRTEYARASLQPDPEGPIAILHPRQGSGSIDSLASADALVILPDDREHFAAGSRLSALRL